MTRLQMGTATAVGPRDANEDRALALSLEAAGGPMGLVAVCDGMGGDENGARAAAEVVKALSWLPSLLPAWEGTPSDARLRASLIQWTRTAVEQLEYLGERRRLSGLTTTLAAALLLGDRLAVWWLGDSRVYRFRDGRLERLTRDHSEVEERLGLEEEEALEHPSRNRVTRFLRPGTSHEPGLEFSDWREGDVVLAVSDGVSGACRTAELEAFLAWTLAAEVEPGDVCRRLLDYLGDNLSDNATVACAWKGTPRPFPGTAVLEPASLRERGLRPEVVQGLNEERRAGSPPPWLEDFACARAAGPPPESDGGEGATCLECGTRLPLGTPCSEHGKASLWTGLYLEIDAPDGSVTRRSIGKGPCLLGAPEGPEPDVVLAGDSLVSPGHAQLDVHRGGALELQDRGSDNGLWVRVDHVLLQDPAWLEQGLSLRIGRHRLVLRDGRRGSRAPDGRVLVLPRRPATRPWFDQVQMQR